MSTIVAKGLGIGGGGTLLLGGLGIALAEADITVLVDEGIILFTAEDVAVSGQALIVTDEGVIALSSDGAIADTSEWYFGADPGSYEIYSPKGGALNFYVYFQGYRTLLRDVSGGTFTLNVKRKLIDTAPVFTLSSGAGIYPHGDCAVRVHIPSDLVNQLEKDNHYELVYSEIGNTETILEGAFYVDPTVTNLELL